MVAFYNKGDQEIYKNFQYVPQEKYRTGFTAPNFEAEKIQTSFGIPAASNFNNSSSSFSPGGNAFGYGSAIKPGDPSVLTSGPYAGQSGYYGSLNYEGGLPGDIAQKGPGRHFEYDNTGKFYRDYSLTPKKEVPGYLRAAAGFIPFGNTALNFIENRMNPTGPMTLDDVNRGSYAVAGLSDLDKKAYNELASSGMLFAGPSGLKTLTGKNFTGKGYLEGQLDLYDKKGYDQYTEDEEGEVYDASGKKLTGFLKKQYLEASKMYKTNQELEKKEKEELAAKGQIRLGSNLIQDTTYKSDPKDSQTGKEQYTGEGMAFAPRKDTFTGGKTVKSSSTPGGYYSSPKKDGGRVGYFYGGLANRVNYKVGGRTDAESQYGADSVGSYDSSQNISDRPQSYGIDNNPPVSTEDNKKIVTTDFISKKPGLTIDYTDPKNYASIYSTIGFNNVLDNDDLTAEGIVTGELGPIDYTTNFTDQGITGTNLTAGNFNANISPDMQLQNLSYNRGPFSISTDGQNIGGKFSISYKNGGLASIL